MCEDGVPEDVWGSFFNIGGGEPMRLVNHEFHKTMFSAMGAPDFRTILEPNWFATQNFHGQWYSDSDRLEALVPFRRETMADVRAQIARAVPFVAKAGLRLFPSAARKRIEHLAASKGGPLYWLAHGDAEHIDAYFGSREAWAKIPGWDRYMLEQPSRTPTRLDHGYDEAKPVEAWTLSDYRIAAAFRGGTCQSGHDGAPYAPARWTCARGHEFSMTPNLLLRGGHWCPTCMVDQTTYDEVAARSPYFAQVWRQGRRPR
jgi:hypothetical protein